MLGAAVAGSQDLRTSAQSFLYGPPRLLRRLCGLPYSFQESLAHSADLSFQE